MRKWTLYIIVAALILGGGGWLILQRQSANSATSNQTVETAVVQRGDSVRDGGSRWQPDCANRIYACFSRGWQGLRDRYCRGTACEERRFSGAAG